jgi:type I restriction enzyme M protein
VVSIDDVRASDYNLSPSQFVEVNDKAQHRPIGEILADLSTARAEREAADAELDSVVAKLGLNGESR